MKYLNNKALPAVILIEVSSLVCQAQDRTPVLIGFQPGITIEKFYDENEFDINIFPFVLELPLSKRVDIRYVNILNYHFGPVNQVSDIGFQLIAPVFIKKKELTNTPSYGFYVGPIYGWGRNFLNNHGTHTVGAEVGYQLSAGDRFTLTFGVQLGGSYFNYDTESNKWTDHFGIKVNLGWWVNTSVN